MLTVGFCTKALHKKSVLQCKLPRESVNCARQKRKLLTKGNARSQVCAALFRCGLLKSLTLCAELKHYVSQSEHEKESESKRLHDRLANEERKRRQIELEMEHHHARFAQLETDKRNAELRAQAESRRDVQARETEALRVKRELEELQLRAAQAENEKRQLELHLQIDAQQRQDNDSLKRQLEELRSKAVAMERQQRVMEREMQEQVELRAYAEAEANRAAAAAELSAQAAIEAANIRSPFDVRRKRYLSGGSDDVDMEDAAHSPPARAPSK